MERTETNCNTASGPSIEGKRNPIKPARKALGEITNLISNRHKPLSLKKISREPIKFTNANKLPKIAKEKPKRAKIDKIPVAERLIILKQEEKETNSEDTDIFNVRTYSFDIFNYWLYLENKNLLSENYLNGHMITPNMRALLVDWLHEVSEHFNFTQETFQLSVALTDRYLVKKKINKNVLQLVGIGAIFIAMKYEELFTVDLKDLEFICDGCYKGKEILAMERELIQTIDYSVGIPVPLNFLRRLSRVSKTCLEQHTFAKYLIDMALYEYSFCHIKPSKLAAAATFISKCLVNEEVNKSQWDNNLVSYSSYEIEDFENIICLMAQNASSAKESTYKSIYGKYASNSMYQVSIKLSLPSKSLILSDLCSPVNQ